MVNKVCEEHGALCQTLGRIEGQLTDLAKSNMEQWEKIDALLAKNHFRNGVASTMKDQWARWTSIVSTLIAIGALVISVWKG